LIDITRERIKIQEDPVLDAKRPKLNLLSEAMVKQIVEEAVDVLVRTGVLVENEEGLSLLHDAGCHAQKQSVQIPEHIIEKALKTVPGRIQLFNRNGEIAMDLENDNVHFDPGSAALLILDPDTGIEREPCTRDLIQFARITDAMQNIAAQSTGLISMDVPKEMQDRYRLYIGLQNSQKPIVTGTFAVESFSIMENMLTAIRGSRAALKEKPLAIFDCCPSPPLKWSNLTCQNLIDAARAGIPAELVSMPLTGATAPVTLAGSLVQLTAENLSGIVIHQLAAPGSPIIFGGSPAAFDMRKGTTPMGAVETMMIDSAYAQIGKHLGLPVHAYMGLSDAKVVDSQAGLESGIGTVMAALAGINVISGPGMLNFESCQSLEKLVIDNEICGMALRLIRSVEPRGEKLGVDLYGDIYHGEHFVGSPETLKWFKEELIASGPVIDRDTYDVWSGGGRKTAWDRAREEVRRILKGDQHEPLDPERTRSLHDIMKSDAQSCGLDKLPALE
jgi:trimethylamine--corrinoid protein Co-methyltransferase